MSVIRLLLIAFTLVCPLHPLSLSAHPLPAPHTHLSSVDWSRQETAEVKSSPARASKEVAKQTQTKRDQDSESIVAVGAFQVRPLTSTTVGVAAVKHHQLNTWISYPNIRSTRP